MVLDAPNNATRMLPFWEELVVKPLAVFLEPTMWIIVWEFYAAVIAIEPRTLRSP